ncbi:hypothetical protein ISCGN_014204 [Ixodes scapularis]
MRGGKPRGHDRMEEWRTNLGEGSPKLVLTPPFTGAAWVPCCSFGRGTLSTEQEREARSSLGGDLGEGEGAAAAGLSLHGRTGRVLPPGTGGSCCCPCREAGALRTAAKILGETWVALDSERGAGPLRTTSEKLPFDKKENRFLASEHEMFSFTLMDSRLREAGAEVVYWLTRGAPKGPNLPRAWLNHQKAIFPGHGKATHSQTWAGEPDGSGSVEVPLSKHLLSQVHLAMQRWVLPRSQICLLRQSLQFRLLRPSLLLHVLFRGLFLDLFLELFLELSLGLPLFLGALLLFLKGISGLSGLFLRLRSGLSLSLYSGLFLRPRSGLSLSLVPVLFRRSGLFLGPWLLLLRTLCQGHHQSPWLQSNYLSPIWQFAQTHGQNCSFCRRQKRVHLWSLRERVRHLCLHLRIQWKNSRPSSTHHPRSPSHLQLLYHQRGKVGQYAREDFR